MAILVTGAGWMCGACGEDRTPEFVEKTERCQWIHDVMSEWYLWCDEMPQVSDALYFGNPETFFKKLIVSKDKYSYIEMTGDATGSTSRAINLSSGYGMDFALYVDPVIGSQSAPERMARVLYVLPQSPAEVAGIRRGDWITAVGGETLTTKNYQLLINGPSTTLTTQVLNYDNVDSLYWEPGRTVSLEAGRHLEDNPFYVDTLYQIQGRRIAYLMYNRFSTGPNNTGNETQYDSQMCSIFKRFKEQEPTDFILDLRYNLGGYLSCAQVLASLLAPESANGKIFCKLAFNEKLKNNSTTEVYFFDKKVTKNAGLSLPRIYIITSNLTASASESIINGLRPVMGDENVVLIGSRTEGKNVASLTFKSPYDYTLHPIVATVYNGNGESEYSNGFMPTYSVDELQYISPFYPLGDVRETMLNTTLAVILNSYPSMSQSETTRTLSTTPFLPKPEFTTIDLRQVVEISQ